MSHTPTAAPPLTRLAELIHRNTDETTDAALVTAAYRTTDIEIGFWPIPEGVGHPTEVLVGWLAPPSCDVLGLVSSGWAVPVALGQGVASAAMIGTNSRERVRITTLLARDGTSASVIASEGDPGADPRVIAEVPAGWGADALARSLGRPTPQPVTSIGACVEGAWLAAIEHRIWPDFEFAPCPLPQWEEIAMLHPLAPVGMALSADILARQVRALERESNWRRLRQLFGQAQVSLPLAQPPGGTKVTLARWFDDGSFARWTERRQPAVTDSLFEILDVLPDHVGHNLMAALTTVVAPHLLPEPFGLGAQPPGERNWVNPCHAG